MKVKNVGIDQACQVIFDIVGDTKEASSDLDNDKFIRSVLKTKKMQNVADIPMEIKSANVEYLVSRGYSEAILKQHGAFHCKSGPLKSRIVFPVNDREGHAVAYTGRTLFNGQDSTGVPQWKKLKIPKWKHIGDTGKSLFNLSCAAEFIKKYQAAVVCEGPLDCLRLESLGIKIAVGCLGAAITDAQKDLLIESGALKLFIGLDNDAAGLSGFKLAVDKLGNCFDIVNLIPSDSHDWGESSAEHILASCKVKGVPVESA